MGNNLIKVAELKNMSKILKQKSHKSKMSMKQNKIFNVIDKQPNEDNLYNDETQKKEHSRKGSSMDISGKTLNIMIGH